MSLHHNDDGGFRLNTFDFVANETAPPCPPLDIISDIETEFVAKKQATQKDQDQQQLEDTFLLFANAEQKWQLPSEILEDQQQAIPAESIFLGHCLPSNTSAPVPALINCHGTAAVQQEHVSADPLLNCIRKIFTLIREICSKILETPNQSGIESNINGIFLLREKVIEVRKKIVARVFTNTLVDTRTVLLEIDREFDSLTVIINQATAAAKAANSESQYEEGHQMGLDLLGKLRHLFWPGGAKESPIPTASEQARGSNSIPTGNGPLSDQGSSRKRRNHDDGGNFKYRRVDNTFPKFITNESAGDYSSMATHTMAEHRDRMQRRSQLQQQHPQQQDTANPPTNLTHRSMFSVPQTTHTRVRSSYVNPSTVMIDLSDEDELPNDMLPYVMFTGRRSSVSRRDKDRDRCPLLSSSSGVRPQMLYSDAVRLGQNGFSGGYTDMRINGHSQAHVQDTITAPVSNLADSLLMQDEQRSEHEQYLNLIQNLSNPKSVAAAPRTKPRLPPLPPPPPLHRISKSANQETTSNAEWFRLLDKRKPERLHLPSPFTGSIEREQYAKLLDKGTGIGMVSTPPPPPLMRCNSATSATSHASTVDSSSSGSNPSGSSGSSSTSSSSSGSVISFTTKPKKSTTTVVAPTGMDGVIELDDDSNDEKDLVKPNGSLSGNITTSPLSTMLQQTEALQRRFQNCIFFKDDFAENFNQKCARQRKESVHSRELAQLVASKTTEERQAYEQGLRENISKYRMVHKPIFVIDGFQLTDDKNKTPEFLPITDELYKRYNELIQGPPQQVLVSKFSLNITRNDIRTLIGSMWLNDEVINFYMNLLTDRSQRKAGKLPSVYAMNTFFVPRLLQNGHNGVKRWTRKVDLFNVDIIPVPVHVGGVHWCMAIIHMKNKTIRYYDSMGKPNQTVLNALEAYLREESLDKRKQPFDTSDFVIENVPNVPQQTNGSDCGVFSCMFAEYITRNKQLTFAQEHMEYFRKKMILEICSGELWM